MLRLESIVLQGFKSFADRTKLTFPTGITCIVGPNGCGKSNISDAIAWVLGEQSPKSLRGEKMGDVIFAGSPTRTSSGHAFVAMTWIREADQDHQTERLEVGRKLFKNGDSEYLLNGKQCRLKDLQVALLDFGMGTKTYSIIEQGKVGQILSSKPTERRQLLEEAAGILKYKMRRHESQLKLRSAEENLQRLQDILLEVQKQRNYLKRQVGKARRYKLHKARLREIDRAILSFDIHHYTESYRRVQSDYREINKLEQEASKQVTDLEEGLRKRRSQAITQEEAHKQSIRNANETAKAIERLRQKTLFLEERHKERQFNLHALHVEKEKSGEHQQTLQEDLALCEKDLGHVEETLKQQKNDLTNLQSGLEKEVAQLQRANAHENELRKELESLKTRLHGLDIENTQIIRQKSLLETQLDDLVRSSKELSEEQETLKTETQKTSTALQGLRDENRKLTEQIKNQEEVTRLARVERDRSIQEVRESEKSLHQVSNQKANLEALLKQRQDLSDSVRHVLKKANGKPTLLRDLLDSDHRFDREMEWLLGDLAQSFVIFSDQDAHNLQPFFQKHAIGVIDLRNCPNVGKRSSSEHGAILEGAVRLDQTLNVTSDCPEAYRAPLKQTLCALFSWRIILPSASFNLEQARELAIKNPSLQVVFQGQPEIMLGNSSRHLGRSGKSRGFLTLKGEIAELASSEEALKSQNQKAVEAEQRARSVCDSSEKALDDFLLERRTMDRRIDQLVTQEKAFENQRQQLIARQERETRRSEQLLESQRHIHDREVSIEKERGSLVDNLQQLEKDFESRTHSVSSLKEHVQEQRNQEIRLKEKIDAAGILKQRIEEEYTQIKAMLKSQVENEQNRLTQVKTIEKELVDIDEQLAHGRTELKNLESRFQLEEGRGQAKERELGDQRKEIEIQELHLTDLRNRRDDMRAKQGRLDLEQARITSELTHLKESFALSQNEPFQSVRLEDLPAEETIQTYKTERTDIKRKLSELGTVNLLAVEEYDEVEERYEFLINQQKDLVDSIAEIRTTIRTLNRESVTRFKQAFDEINLIFQDTFVALFGGGQARLELLDDENVLDSGIDMIIQPPGKKLQNAMLLSGGEKALAATALLFSIFEYKPSPFCLLDEVDAPLDEANVMRLTKKLDKMKQQTQFIMITHHKSTMAIASSLFGVTMEENGCSKLVSVNFN